MSLTLHFTKPEFCICPLPAQLNPAGSALTQFKLAAALVLGDGGAYVSDEEAAKLLWPQWPALRALLLPRLRLIYNGLAALIVSPDLSDDDARQVLTTIALEAGVTAKITASVHVCGGGAGPSAAPSPLVVELAQILVQPQFLNMIQAGAAWARQRAQLDFSHLDRVDRIPLSVCFNSITAYGMDCLHNCFCIRSPFPIEQSSPKLQQAAFSWCAAVLQMLKTGGLQGPWPARTFVLLSKSGLSFPLITMLRIAKVEAYRFPQPLLPWAERPRCLECALQAAEWILSAASTGELCDDGFILNLCSKLVAMLAESGMGQGKVWGRSGPVMV